MEFHFVGIKNGGLATILDSNANPRFICFKEKGIAKTYVTYLCEHKTHFGVWPTVNLSTPFAELRSFDCNNEDHVLWLREVGQGMAKTIGGEKMDIIQVVKNNPLPGKPSIDNPMDWAYVHFQLCMKYANAVLNHDAFIPKK
jgi:hypothetical protein